jgi:hypothetical protein
MKWFWRLMMGSSKDTQKLATEETSPDARRSCYPLPQVSTQGGEIHTSSDSNGYLFYRQAKQPGQLQRPCALSPRRPSKEALLQTILYLGNSSEICTRKAEMARPGNRELHRGLLGVLVYLRCSCAPFGSLELERELIQTYMAQKPLPWVEVSAYRCAAG